MAGLMRADMYFTTDAYNSVRDFVIKNRRSFVTAALVLQAACANYLGFILRFESILSPYSFNKFLAYLPLLLVIRLFFYLQSGLYKSLWRYASINDLVKIVKTSTVGSITFLVSVRYLIGDTDYPRSIYMLDWLLFILMSGGSRLLVRIMKEFMYYESSARKILIVGAGDEAELLVRDMKNNPKCSYKPIGFIDDDPYKKGLTIHEVPILGPTGVLPEVIRTHAPDEVIISLPSTDHKSVKEIYELCKPFNIAVKKLPGLGDILDGNVSISAKLGLLLSEANLLSPSQIEAALELQRKEGGKFGSKLVKLGYITEANLVSFLQRQYSVSKIKPLSLEDLLQREPLKAEIKSVRDYIEGKTVLVSGAGGSIGSELCRQIVNYGPSRLILIDRYENSLFHIDRELNEQQCQPTEVLSVICDIQDEAYLDYIFARHAPKIVFHAAAYKHVPLMEHNPVEAVKNNVFGTKNLLEISARHGAESFVTISTDKAVNPTSIMGATKRFAEFLTVNMNLLSTTKFSAVRFGNVLGTNGSVIPIFKEQLQRGGPIKVTHPEIKRFFMLIHEAMQLVLIAAAAGRGGEIFVLDMGEPIRIMDLAENLIRLSGLIPHKEIKIEFTGLRPGEKLYEELFDSTEKILPTFHEKIKMAVPEVPSAQALGMHIEVLERFVRELSSQDVIKEIQRAVPSYMASRNDYDNSNCVAGRPAF